MKKRVLIALVVALALLATASLVWANGGGLVSYWPFDEGSGTTANDAVNGNHGTIHGATYTTDRAPVIGNDYALAFDGNDYVQVANPSTLEPAYVTVAAWVKSSSPGTYGYILAKGASGCTAASYALYSRGPTSSTVAPIDSRLTVAHWCGMGNGTMWPAPMMVQPFDSMWTEPR
jgi:hypothetical protein